MKTLPLITILSSVALALVSVSGAVGVDTQELKRQQDQAVKNFGEDLGKAKAYYRKSMGQILLMADRVEISQLDPKPLAPIEKPKEGEDIFYVGNPLPAPTLQLRVLKKKPLDSKEMAVFRNGLPQILQLQEVPVAEPPAELVYGIRAWVKDQKIFESVLSKEAASYSVVYPEIGMRWSGIQNAKPMQTFCDQMLSTVKEPVKK